MTHPAVVASNDLKKVGNEITQWENRLDFVKTEVQKNTQVRDSLLATISQKTQDFDSYMAQKDADVKKSMREMQDQRDQLGKEKEEFMGILKQHQTDKASFEQDQKNFEIQKLKHEANKQNVQDFVTAVRRAVGLLGI